MTAPASGSAKVKGPITLDHLRSRKQPRSLDLPICLDPKLADEFADAQGEMQIAEVALRERPHDREMARKLEDAQAIVEELRPRVEAETVTFSFRSLGREAYDDLVDKHPPTQKQRVGARKDGVGELQVDPDVFPLALIAASLVDPDLSFDDVKALWNDTNWNQAELTRLYSAAISVNSTSRVVDLGKG